MVSERKLSVNHMIRITMLSAIAFVLMLIEVPVVVFPGFLKIDISDVPALLAGFSMGPIAGVAVVLVKNVLHLLKTTTGGVGEFANFIVGAALVFPAAFIYQKNKTKTGAVAGLAVGAVIMAIVGGLANYYILIPFYQNFMPIDAIIGMGTAANAAIIDLKTLILYGIVPFNLFKALIVSIITILIYKRLSNVLHN